MNYHQAQNILDARRAGADMPQIVVRKALELTGDLTPLDADEWTIPHFASASSTTAHGSQHGTGLMPCRHSGTTGTCYHGWSCDA